MENFKAPVPVEWSNRRVLTTAQLAKYYVCPVEHIRDNFRKNRDRFVANKHYFKLEGEALKTFRNYTENFRLVENDYTENFRPVENDYTEEGIFPVVPARTPSLYLWTERGAARHAKMLSTDKAWEIFEELEDCYFSQNISAIVSHDAPVDARTKPAPNPKRREGQLNDARVYVFKMSDGNVIIVKIGQSKDVKTRKASVERKTKLTVEKIYYTPLMPRTIARLIEQACHDFFSSSKLGGEIFSVKFEEACKVIDSFVKVVACLQVSDIERGEKIFSVARVMTDSSEKQQLLVNSAKLIAGRKFD